MRTYLFTITEKLTSRQKLEVSHVIGTIQKQDYGKQVFDVDGVMQIENNEQRDARIALDSEPTQIPLAQFIEKRGLRFECRRVESRPDGLMSENDGQRHFRCKIMARIPASIDQLAPYRNHKSYSMSLYFSQGSTHTSDPTLADVLDCLAMDASGFENAKPSKQCKSWFDNWAEEYGYDTDSRSAEKIFRATKRQSEQLKRTLGMEAYEELLYSVERL